MSSAKNSQHIIKALLIDDEDDFRLSISKALLKRNIEVIGAARGSEGINLLKVEDVEIIILDLNMPEKTGLETLEDIRKISQDIPVIILTGHGNMDNAIETINLNISEFLQKPVDIRKLVKSIEKHSSKTGQAEILREKSITEIMCKPEEYVKILSTESVEKAVEIFMENCFTRNDEVPKVRSLLVYTLEGKFRGILQFKDLLTALLPEFLKKSPYSSYFSGMFIAQCKLIGNFQVEDILPNNTFIPYNSPIMEALQIMNIHNRVTLPVMKNDELIGVLRERDLVRLISEYIST